MTKGHKAAGGVASKTVTRQSVRTGVGGRGIGKNWVSQIGQSLGDHATESGKILRGNRADVHRPPNFQPVKLGNEVALNVGKGGCGTGRTLFGESGSQRQWGNPDPGNPRPRGELFPGWPSKK
jgi:hypothetical protein